MTALSGTNSNRCSACNRSSALIKTRQVTKALLVSILPCSRSWANLSTEVSAPEQISFQLILKVNQPQTNTKKYARPNRRWKERCRWRATASQFLATESRWLRANAPSWPRMWQLSSLRDWSIRQARRQHRRLFIKHLGTLSRITTQSWLANLRSIKNCTSQQWLTQSRMFSRN